MTRPRPCPPAARRPALSRGWVTPLWGERVAFRFRVRGVDGAPLPEALAAIDAMTAVMAARRRGETPSPAAMASWARAQRKAAFRDRVNGRMHAKGSSGVGEMERLAFTAEACMRYAAVILELRDARLRDRSI